MNTPAHYRLSDLLFDSDQPLPELAAASLRENESAEVHVSWRPARTRVASATPFSAWLTPEGDEWLTFADSAGGFLLTFPEHGQFEVSRDGAFVAVFPFEATPPETTRHLLLNQILPLVMSRRGRLVLHASAISYGDQVVAFIGRSGAGKSTFAVACAQAGASIVADDCLVVNRADGGWRVVPCHAGVRLWPAALDWFGWHAESGAATAHYTDKRRLDDRNHSLVFERRELPLAAIHYLPPISAHDAPTPALNPAATPRVLRGRDAVMALASELFRLDCRDAAESRRQFDAVSALASEIPVEIPAREAPATAAQALLCRMTSSWRRSRD